MQKEMLHSAIFRLFYIVFETITLCLEGWAWSRDRGHESTSCPDWAT